MINNIFFQIGGGEGGNQQLVFFVVVFAVFWFFMIRPQVKKQKEETKFRSEIKKGDKVITLGGIHAKVLETNDETLIIQAEGGTSKFKINKTSIAKV